MKPSPSLVLLMLAASAVASCDRSGGGASQSPAAPAADPAGKLVERAGPARWNDSAGGFELNGQPVKTAKLWTFDGSTDGFTAVKSQIVPAPGQGLAMTVADPTLRSPKGLGVAGSQYPLVLVRLTRTGAGAGWDGALYYSTPSHPEAIGYLGKPRAGADPKVGETTTLVYDMSHQTTGGPDWAQSVIDQLRFDLEDKPGGKFVIRQVAIAANPAQAAVAPPATPPSPPPKPKP